MKYRYLLAYLFLFPSLVYAQKIETSDYEIASKVFNWQISDYQQNRTKRYVKPFSELSWLNGTLFRGILEWAYYYKNPEAEEFVLNILKENKWQLQPHPYHADHLCMGQVYLLLYKKYKNPDMIQATKSRVEAILKNPSTQSMDIREGCNRWTWCDALFMAPPVFAKMYEITGDISYLEFMDKEYKTTVDHLYNHKYHLFYRDINALNRSLKENREIFWGRGNGWVFGGLASILAEFPKDWPQRSYYEDLFKEMAQRILLCQDPEGSWHADMLDHINYPVPENSASSFFVYGLAWGINNNILKGRKYKIAAIKGWEALKRSVSSDGKLGFVQTVAASPAIVNQNSTAVYGVGAFLLANVEIHKLKK